MRKLRCQGLITVDQAELRMSRKPPLPVPALARIGRHQPVLDGCRDKIEAMSGLRLLPDDHQKLTSVALLRHSHRLDPVERGLVEVEKLPQHVEVTLLTADHFD